VADEGLPQAHSYAACAGAGARDAIFGASETAGTTDCGRSASVRFTRGGRAHR
jgi:hypothetical protein